MLDIKLIREQGNIIAKKLQSRNVPAGTIEKILKLDKEKLGLLQQSENLKSQKNKFNKEIHKLGSKEKEEKLKQMSNIADQEKSIKNSLAGINGEFTKLHNSLPNLPATDVPTGQDESDNEIINKVGEQPTFDFKPLDYMALSKKYDLIDTERAAKVSGSRFGYLKNEGALLWIALIQYSLDIILKEKFTPFFSPTLVKKEVMEKSGYDSYTDGQEAYYIEKDKLFLVGTGEHALLPYHSQEIIPTDQLPLYYTTYSTCYRREAGSYGQDTKGILRTHQFDKQEMLIITRPENSWQEFDHLISIQEKIVKGLGLAYQLLKVCTGDLPKPSAKVVDIECWLPSEKKYRETHSASNCTDYQARLNNIRYKDEKNKSQFPHILNATVITPRILIAILENYQQKDGSINIPKVLQKFTSFKKID